MIINEAEQLLGVTKANIRFYEKEGLLTPSRNESSYREYSEADIRQLKQIVILRKLGIPVQPFPCLCREFNRMLGRILRMVA